MAADLFIERRQACAGVDDEQGHRRPFERGFGLGTHAPRKGRGIIVFPSGGIDDGESQPQQFRIAKATIARHSRLVIDQREFLAHQPVEQGGLADIGSADDDNVGNVVEDMRLPCRFVGRKASARVRTLRPRTVSHRFRANSYRRINLNR
jgi:hypothetical protein